MERIGWMFVVVGLLGLGPACKRDPKAPEAAAPEASGSRTEQAPIHPPPVLWFEPMDLSTGIGERALQLVIDNHGDPVDPALVATLQGQLRLESLEAGQEIPIDVVASRASEPGDLRSNLTVLSREPIDEGWYTLRLARLPAGLEEPMFPSHVRFQDGSIGVRFRRDSAPELWGVRLCEKSAGTSVIVEFSESIPSPTSTDGLVSITQGAKTIGCKAQSVGGSSFGSLALACPTLESNVETEVEVATELPGPAGISLEPSSHRFTPAQLQDWGTGCKLYRSEL